MAREVTAKEKISQANSGKGPSTVVSCKMNHTKGSVFHDTGTGKPIGLIAKKHEQKHCKWHKQKGGSIWLHNTGECTCSHADLTLNQLRDNGSEKN